MLTYGSNTDLNNIIIKQSRKNSVCNSNVMLTNTPGCYMQNSPQASKQLNNIILSHGHETLTLNPQFEIQIIQG